MRSVFVTGASGFIGNTLVQELLRREVRVKCLVRDASNWDPALRAEPVMGQIENPATYDKAIQDCDTVLHLAGRVHARQRQQLFRVNGGGTAALCDACAALETPPHLIYVSSLAAAGPTPPGKLVRDENDPSQPVSDYGRSKRQGEIELQRRASAVPITILRPGMVYGPSDIKFAQLFRVIHRTRVHVVIGFRTPPLSMLFVGDLVRVIVENADRFETLTPSTDLSASEHGVYFLCDDSEFPTYSDLGRRIGKALDRPVIVWPLWRWVGFATGAASQAASALRGQSNILNIDKVHEAVARSWASTAAKARRQVGFHTERPLDERLRETAEGFRTRGWI